MEDNNLLIIFTKNPRKGKVKTRLAKDIGDENALEIYKFLLKHSHKVTSKVKTTKYVYYSEDIPGQDLWDTGSFEKKLQQGGNLGERMENAFRDGFQEGFKSIVIIGSDLLDIDTPDIEKAFSALKDSEYVIGPARDGGYYLLGMNSLNSNIFKNKHWSTSSVFPDTMKDMEGSSVEVLPVQNDIDLLEDIQDHQAIQKLLINDRPN